MRKGFINLGDGVFKGKGLDALNNSQDGYSQLLSYFGGFENMPSSIMKIKKVPVSESLDEPTKKRSYDATSKWGIGSENHNNLKSDRLKKSAFRVSGMGCKSGALSTFPQNVGRTILLLYSNPGDMVFDPFAGHNSRMDLCISNGRHYIGCDLSTDFMRFNRKRAEKLQEDYQDARITLHHCDSRKVPVESGSGDFTITSPPYWDIEFYGDEPEQLGKSETYKGFLGGLKRVMRENFRVLKPGAFAAWFVNDFRKKGQFYLYHMDVIRLARKVGFIAHDLLVVDLGRSIRDCFANQTMKTRILPKRHEYGLIFLKPKESK
jgi:SAM-dependent methyltransferase